jgi:hypothetical protein
MIGKRFKISVSLLVLMWLFFACISDAPFDNPYDPRTDLDFIGGSIRGFVNGYYNPDVALDSAIVHLVPSGISFRTDIDGYYEFTNLLAGDYTIFCTKNGFSSDSIEVNLQNNVIEKNFRLNAIPEITDIQLTTHHISRWWPVDDRYLIDIIVTVEDMDGSNDIDSVWLDLPTYNFNRTMEKGPGQGEYVLTLLDYELPVNSIHMLQGKEIRVKCSDLPGSISYPGSIYITRIIDVVPELISPANQEIITSSPITFKWQPEFLLYPTRYKLEIYQINFGLYTKIFESIPIDRQQSEFIYDVPLIQGDYFWLIYIIDDAGNTSSSKEGTFRVE